MNLKEAELVTEEFCSREDTYNLCPGGKGGWGYVNKNGFCPTFKRKVDYSKIAVVLKKKYLIDSTYRDMLNKASLQGVIQRKLNHPDTWWRGKKHSIETKQKMRDSHIKRFGDSNPQYGKKWITNGLESMMVSSSEIDHYLLKGYRVGRK